MARTASATTPRCRVPGPVTPLPSGPFRGRPDRERTSGERHTDGRAPMSPARRKVRRSSPSASAPRLASGPGASGRELHTPTPNASHITQYAESEPRKNGWTCHVADRKSVRSIRKPTTAASTMKAPTNTANPTAISARAIATPVRTGACRARGATAPRGYPSRTRGAGCPRSPDFLAQEVDRGTSAPGEHERAAEEPLRMRSGYDICSLSVDERGSRVGSRRRCRSGRPACLTAVRVWLPCRRTPRQDDRS